MFAISLRRAAGLTLAFLTAASLAACSDAVTTASSPSASLVLVAESAAQQTLTVGTIASDSLKVRVATNGVTRASGLAVKWSIVSGDGTVSSPTSSTNANGEAAIAFKAGTHSGVTQVSAKVEGAGPAVFDLQQVAGSVSVATAMSDEPTSVMLGTGSVALRILIRDVYGNPVTGQAVYWSVTGGDGIFDSPVSVSDANGVATVNFTPDGLDGSRTIQGRTADGVGAEISIAVVQNPLSPISPPPPPPPPPAPLHVRGL